MKVDGPKGRNWTVILNESERSYEVSLMKVDGPDNENWTVFL